MIETTRSAGGSLVEFERFGHGENLVLLGDVSALVPLLDQFFTVVTIVGPPAPDSLAAVVAAIGPAGVYSDGAAAVVAGVTRRAVHELSGPVGDIPTLVIGGDPVPGSIHHVLDGDSTAELATVLEEFFG